ncbi:MAG: type VI secretion system-associated FHA domain protein TagH [Sphingomonadales bacterium]|jgi:type VI secretion system FHA domain protein
MSCTLTIENVDSLASGDPVTMVLNEHGLSIGRAAHADWTLPDPKNFISSLHCDIDFVDGHYVLTDRSTNGTFLNGAGQRMAAPHRLCHGDLIKIGVYEVRINLTGTAASAGSASPFGAASTGGGLDWLTAAGGGASQPADVGKFGREAPRALFQSNDDPLMAGFAPPAAVAAPAAADPFGLSGGAPAANPFGLGGGAAPANPFGLAATTPPAPAPAPAPAGNPFGIAVPAAPAPASDPFGLSGAPAAAPANPFAPPPEPAAPLADNPWAKLHAFDQIDFAAGAATPPPEPPPAAGAPAAAPPAAAPAATGDAYGRFLAAAGLKPRDVEGLDPGQVMEAAGQLLRQATDGLMRLLDARTRVRHQFGVGAQVTRFQAQGNNPLKWTRVPEQALRQMVGEPDRGFLTGPQAVQGAFEDLQAHEVAMLAAMQDALSATVQRFSPDAIKARGQARGGLLPGAKEAALWRTFETEYRALAAESDAAFLDLFARQFRAAYERAVKKD